MARKVTTMDIHVENINESDALALESFLAMMQHLGNDGCSRWLALYADGDGACRPKVQVSIGDADMHDAEVFKGLENQHLWTRDGEWRLDSDLITSLRNPTAAPKAPVPSAIGKFVEVSRKSSGETYETAEDPAEPADSEDDGRAHLGA